LFCQPVFQELLWVGPSLQIDSNHLGIVRHLTGQIPSAHQPQSPKIAN